jgi:uncharacterized protein with ParB-like and HNH nuclease domain
MTFNAQNFCDSRSLSLGDFLRSGSYKIPEYQRDFAWDENQFYRLWQDIQSLIENNWTNLKITSEPKPHFFGAIVVESSGDVLNPECIVDGQQRIVCITILLSILHEFSNHIQDPSTRENLTSFIFQLICNSGEGAQRKSRILLGNEHEFFENFIIKKFTEFDRNKYWKTIPDTERNRIKNKIFECESFFRNKIKARYPHSDADYAENIKILYQTLIEYFVILKLTVKSPKVAYSIFETLNERGLELSQADLIKNEVMRLADIKGELKKAVKYWEEIVKALPDTDSAVTIFLRFQYLSKHGSCQAQDLFDKILNLLKPKDVINYLEELKIESKLYSKLLQSSADNTWNDKINKALDDINVLNISHSYPLLLSGSIRFGNDESSFEKMVLTTRNFCFRFLTIGKKGVANLETHIGNSARMLRNESNDLNEVLKSVVEHDSDTSFKENFALFQTNKTKIVFFIIKEIEDHLAKGQGITVLQHSPSQHIEHIMPKNPGQWWNHVQNDERYENYLWKLGNLLILEKDINKEIKNLDYGKKYKNTSNLGYSNSKLKLPAATTQFLDTKGKWNFDSIIKRQKYLAKKYACNVWPLNI